jgi:predicted transcriptional regulator
MGGMSDTLSIRLTQGLRRQLERISKRQNRPASEVAREALRRYIAAEELRQLREKLRPHAEARGFLTDEDVFKAAS